MPRETLTAPATLPLFSTSGASRTSRTRVFPFAIISFACAAVTRGTAALAASIICLTLVVMIISRLCSVEGQNNRRGGGGKEPRQIGLLHGPLAAMLAFSGRRAKHLPSERASIGAGPPFDAMAGALAETLRIAANIVPG